MVESVLSGLQTPTRNAGPRTEPIAVASSFVGWSQSSPVFGVRRLQGPQGSTNAHYLCSFRTGNSDVGVATSPAFAVTHPYINFKICGGKEIGSTSFNLLIDGVVVRSSVGEGTLLFKSHSWDVREFKDKSAQIQLVDHSSKEFGFVLVDDVFQADEPSAYPASSLYHLKRTFTRRASVVLATTCTAPGARTGTLSVFAPVPPTIPSQRLVSCSLDCPQIPNLQARNCTDLGDPDQTYKVLDIPLAGGVLDAPLTVDMKYTVDLYDVELALGEADRDPEEGLLKPLNIDLFRAESQLANYSDPGFQSFLKQNNLVKSAGEPDLVFAHRVLVWVGNNYSYKGGFVGYEGAKASKECTRRTGDCGMLNSLYCSIVRANGIPCTTLAGRWALEETPDYGQFHVKAMIYQPGIGWIPVDASAAVGARASGQNPATWFGKNDGIHIAFSGCMDLRPTSDDCLPLLQFMHWSYKGHGPFMPRYEDHWHLVGST